MGDDVVLDKAKGELRIFGKRHIAIDAQALCDQLDLMVGPKVAEVMINQHEVRLGKEDVIEMRAERPQATVRELVDLLISADAASGMGITEVAIPQNPPGPIDLQISNPCMKRTSGAGKALLFSYWCGALTELLGTELKVNYVTYDESNDVLKCQFIPVSSD